MRLRIGTTGVKTFIVRKRVAGRLRNITLGRYGPRLGLKEAGAKARQIISDIEAGGDPVASVREERAASGPIRGSVRAMFNDYMAAAVREKKRSEKEIERLFAKLILPEIGDRLADAMTRGDVTRLVDKIAIERGAVTARHCRSQLSAFYTWAMPRLDRLPANPCRDSGRPITPGSRDRVLSEAELRAVWNATEAEHFPSRHMVRLLILTGQRRSEVVEARWHEFDIEGKLWTIPAGRAKNGREHLVPLSPSALAVLDGMYRIAGSDLLFPSRSNVEAPASGISKLVSRLVAAVETEIGEPVERWTLHDLRRTMATGLQRLGTRLEVTEAVLNHVGGSRAGIVDVYQRHDYLTEKRHAMEMWAADVERIIAGKPRGNVVAIRG